MTLGWCVFLLPTSSQVSILRSKNPSSVSIDIRSEPPPSSAVLIMMTLRSACLALPKSFNSAECDCEYRKS